jgi:hypothetical protein
MADTDTQSNLKAFAQNYLGLPILSRAVARGMMGPIADDPHAFFPPETAATWQRELPLSPRLRL